MARRVFLNGERATTPDLTEMVRRPHLSRVTPLEDAEFFSPLDFSKRESVKDDPCHEPKTPPPILCEIDRATPIIEQIHSLERDGLIKTKYADMVLLDALPPPPGGAEKKVLAQHCFARQKPAEILRTEPLSFADGYAFLAYLRRNTRVGLAYDLWELMPVDRAGQILLCVRRYGQSRYLIIQHLNYRVLKLARVLVVSSAPTS